MLDAVHVEFQYSSASMHGLTSQPQTLSLKQIHIERLPLTLLQLQVRISCYKPGIQGLTKRLELLLHAVKLPDTVSVHGMAGFGPLGSLLHTACDGKQLTSVLSCHTTESISISHVA